MHNTAILITFILSLLSSKLLSAETVGQNFTKATSLSLFDSPSYLPTSTAKTYVNPDAPKKGSVTLAGFGSFDTLNPYLLKGISPINTPGMGMYGFSEANEPLMVGTGDYLPSGMKHKQPIALSVTTLSTLQTFHGYDFPLTLMQSFMMAPLLLLMT